MKKIAFSFIVSMFAVAVLGDVRTYTVEFDPDGGAGEMSPILCTNGVSFNLPESTFKWLGHDFEYWNFIDDAGEQWKIPRTGEVDVDLTTNRATVVLKPDWKVVPLKALWMDEVGYFNASKASVWNGWYVKNDTAVIKGTFTIKMAASKSGERVKADITFNTSTGKKAKLRCGYDPKTGKIDVWSGQTVAPTAFNDEFGFFASTEIDLKCGPNGIYGTIGGTHTLNGARDFSKETATVDNERRVLDEYKGECLVCAFESSSNSVCNGFNAFSIAFSAGGKAKVTGWMTDGRKIPVTTVMSVGRGFCALPVNYRKSGSEFAFVLLLNRANDYEDRDPRKCDEGFYMNTNELAMTEPVVATDIFRGLWHGSSTEAIALRFVAGGEPCDYDMWEHGMLPSKFYFNVYGMAIEVNISSNGKKWTIDKEKYPNLKAKIAYSEKNGLITGSYKYNRDTCKFNGVLIDTGKYPFADGYGRVVEGKTDVIPFTMTPATSK